MNDKWIKINGYEDYLLNECGIVYSLKRQKFLKPDKSKYYRVTLSKNGETKRFQTHRLVAEHYLNNKHNKNIVHHIDGNHINNHYLNLMWCTDKEHNDIHGYENFQKTNESNKLKIIMIGENSFIKFDSIADGARYILDKNGKELVRNNIKNSVSRILAVCKGKRKSAYGYKWKYIK